MLFSKKNEIQENSCFEVLAVLCAGLNVKIEVYRIALKKLNI
jgi:hypothetical protein